MSLEVRNFCNYPRLPLVLKHTVEEQPGSRCMTKNTKNLKIHPLGHLWAGSEIVQNCHRIVTKKCREGGC